MCVNQCACLLGKIIIIMSVDYVLHDVVEGSGAPRSVNGGQGGDESPRRRTHTYLMLIWSLTVVRGTSKRAYILSCAQLSGAPMVAGAGWRVRAGAALMAAAGAIMILVYAYLSLPIFLDAPVTTTSSTALLCYIVFRVAVFTGGSVDTQIVQHFPPGACCC